MVAQATSGLVLSELDPALQYFCEEGLAVSTRKTYHSALKRFTAFCSLYSILSPFLVSESLLCYFSSYLACQNVSPQMIKTHLAGIRHTQITLGLPDPKDFSSLSQLRQVQAGIQKTYCLLVCSEKNLSTSNSSYFTSATRPLGPYISRGSQRCSNTLVCSNTLLFWIFPVRRTYSPITGILRPVTAPSMGGCSS